MDYVTIKTSQNVSIDYPLAGVGPRIGAFLIDLFAYWVAIFLLIYTFPWTLFSSTDGLAIAYFTAFFGFLGYFFLAELFFGGQTLGKRLVGLRVIRLDGDDPTPADFLIRALFLLPDAILSFGIPAILLIATGRYHQRLGDMVATTTVILSSMPPGRSLHEIVNLSQRENYEPRFPGVQRYTNSDMLIVKRALERARRYGNAGHRRALRQLSVRIANDLGLEIKKIEETPARFLEIVLYDYIVLTR